MGEVAHLFVAASKHGPMMEHFVVRAIANRGFEGCAHGRHGSKRQVLLVEEETLRDFGLAPGIVRENVTARGIRLKELAAGERLRVGHEAILEVTIPCEPCGQLETIRPGLMNELQGRRGILCRVIEGGMIRSGDAIEVDNVAVVAAGQNLKKRKAESA